MNTTKNIYRHGDVLICSRDGFKIPDNQELNRMDVLFKGGQHIHSIVFGLALESFSEGKRYMRVIEPLTLDHPEHGKGFVPVGDYWIENKREYDHMAEEARTVVD